VTSGVLEWYRRFAQGRPAAIVVEATGIRDVPSGPLLRIGHDRFIAGLAELVRVVREASSGETKLLIQLIDFLTIRRRPDPNRFLREFLVLTHSHRARLDLQGAPDALVRERLLSLGDAGLDQVLSARELESRGAGYRERVTDIELAHVRDLPRRCRACSPTRRTVRERPGSTASSCTTRTPTRWPRSCRRRTTGRTATGLA
jgi:hypothetical protein